MVESKQSQNITFPEQAIELCAMAHQASKDKNLQAAVQLATRALAIAPEMSKCSLLLSSIFIRTRRFGDAIQVLKRALKSDQANPGIWNNLGNAYRCVEQWAPARGCFERALKIKPDYRMAWDNLLQTQMSQKDASGALNTIDKITQFFGGSEQKLILAKGDSLLNLDRLDEALACFEEILAQPPYSTHALDRWVKVLLKLEKGEEYLGRLHEMSALDPENASIWGCIGSIENRLDNGENALAAFKRAHELAPSILRHKHDIGIVERHLGNIEEAHQCFLGCLEMDPFHPSSLRVFGSEHKYEYGDEAFMRVNRAAARLPILPPDSQVQLHFALGKAFDDVGDLATAFEHYITGGHTHLKLNPFNDDERSRLHHVLTRNLTKETLGVPEEPGCTDPTPIFILGMPRSGTSLTEQVLASHPDIYGAGELKLLSKAVNGVVLNNKHRINFIDKRSFWSSDERISFAERGARYIEALRSLADDTPKHIVDKMPGNHVWVGMIHLFMPHASIIHTRRHPVETCLSCFRIFFPDGLLWSYDLRELGKAYRYYDEIMTHWRTNLPAGRMLEVRYEDMVNDFSNEAKRIIDYIGLDWDDACLKFHENARPVRTASASQVRKPVYKTSIGRWQKYAPYLKPLLQELGPLVQQYEDELQ